MGKNNFFEEQKEQSLVKSTIVAKYFDIWAKVIISTQKRYPYRSQKNCLYRFICWPRAISGWYPVDTIKNIDQRSRKT